jgi:hypothetical protein
VKRISAGWLPALATITGFTLAGPAQAVPVRAIFTGTITNTLEDAYPTGLGPGNTFQWAAVFNPAYNTNATVTGNLFQWLQLGPLPNPIYDITTLTRPYNTGITGISYNSPNTPPKTSDVFNITNSSSPDDGTFVLRTGRSNSNLTVEIDGEIRELSNLEFAGRMPGLNPSSSLDVTTFLSQAIGPSGSYTCSTTSTAGCGGTGFFQVAENQFQFSWTAVTLEVPGPIGIAGLAPLLAYSRKLRRTINSSSQNHHKKVHKDSAKYSKIEPVS